AAFVERTLSGPERDDVEAHLDTCGSCREAVALVAATEEGAPRRIGRYRLDRVIGSGGLGGGWQARGPPARRGPGLQPPAPPAAPGWCARRARWPGCSTRTWSRSTTSASSPASCSSRPS